VGGGKAKRVGVGVGWPRWRGRGSGLTGLWQGLWQERRWDGGEGRCGGGARGGEVVAGQGRGGGGAWWGRLGQSWGREGSREGVRVRVKGIRGGRQ
nr:hypothetical protein [Tanacetum cinerariifolium]